MAELSVQDRDAILRLLFGGTVYLGLSRDTPDDEELDPNYRRRAVTLSDPQGDDVRFVTNEQPILFPEYAQDASKPLRFAILSDAPSGGVIKWSDRLKEPEQMRAGGIVFFAAGRFKIGVP